MRRWGWVVLWLWSLVARAITPGDAETRPEADVGLEAEAIPEQQLQIPHIELKIVNGKPQIDGDPREPFWQQGHRFELDIELYPERLAPAVVRTQAWVAATSTHLYVAFIADDPDIKEIRSAVREHDASKEDDYVSVIIDPTGTLAKKYEFRVNPDGSLSDVLQDTISDRYIYDWDTEWRGAATRTEQGYRVEIAIPAGAIRITQPKPGEQQKGAVILKRSYPRSVDRTLATFFTFDRNQVKRSAAGVQAGSTEVTPAAVGETRPERALGKAGADDQGLADKLMSDRLTLTPHYIYHLDETRNIGGSFSREDDHNLHAGGFDAEYALSTSESLALTVNPNFTEVEADIARQSINNPFNVFKPEKRRFFKVATEYYSTLIPTVYSRNIIRPKYGLSYIRDDDRWSYAGFAVADRDTEFVMPDNLGSDTVEVTESSFSLAGRMRLAQGKRSYGVISTLRTGDNYHNLVVGLDGLLDLGPDDKFRFQLLGSDTEYPQSFAESLCEVDGCTELPIPTDPADCLLGSCPLTPEVLRADFGNRLNGYAFQARYKHDGPEGLYWLGYEETSPDYRADLGFHRKADIRSINLAYGEKWYVEAFRGEGKSRIRAYLIANHSRSYEYDDQLNQELSPWIEFRGSLQSVFRLGYRTPERAVNRINQASLETGDNAPLFDEKYWQWYFEISPKEQWKLHLDGRVGEMADSDNLVLGDMVELKPKLIYRVGGLKMLAELTHREFDLDNERLYKERFFSFTLQYRRRHNISHRLLFLDDLTEQDVDRWRGDADEQEIERTLEYTLTYKPTPAWKILAGIKLLYEDNAEAEQGELTERELYMKAELKL